MIKKMSKLLTAAALPFLLMGSARAFMAQGENQVSYLGKGYLTEQRNPDVQTKYKVNMDLVRLDSDRVKITQHYFFEGKRPHDHVFIVSHCKGSFYRLINERRRQIGTGYCYDLKAPGSRKCHYHFDQEWGGRYGERDQFFTVRDNVLFRMGEDRSDHRGTKIWRESFVMSSGTAAPTSENASE